MCGRFVLYASPSEIAYDFDVDVRDNFPPRYNIAPSQPIAVIAVPDNPDPNRPARYQLMRWGFLPEWAARRRSSDSWNGTTQRDSRAPMQTPMINARSETVATKPSFRNAFRRRRCLIPANGFYEWTKTRGTGRNQQNQPYYIRPAETGVFAFAAIWETLLDPGGGEMDGVAILTTKAGEDIRHLFLREPILIPKSRYRDWLYTDERDLGDLSDLLRPASKSVWLLNTVDSAVGNVRNDYAGLIKPVGQADLFA